MADDGQADLFNDFEDARVLRSVGGFFIGHFQKDNDAEPVKRLSEYYSTEEKAETALNAGTWTPRDNQI